MGCCLDTKGKGKGRLSHRHGMMKARTEEAKRVVAVGGGGANLATLVEGGGRHRLAISLLDETVDPRCIESSGKGKDDAQPWPSLGVEDEPRVSSRTLETWKFPHGNDADRDGEFMVGALALTGMPDAQSKPVLVCSLNDNTVRLYDLPSFSDRGRIFSKQEIRAIQTGPGGLFFTGDGTGELKKYFFLKHCTVKTSPYIALLYAHSWKSIWCKTNA
uniref:Uncharacterized protein n=1 Tax=Aegilops tauschii TaxID=37682 RepID=M8BHX7_AEGTA